MPSCGIVRAFTLSFCRHSSTPTRNCGSIERTKKKYIKKKELWKKKKKIIISAFSFIYNHVYIFYNFYMRYTWSSCSSEWFIIFIYWFTIFFFFFFFDWFYFFIYLCIWMLFFFFFYMLFDDEFLQVFSSCRIISSFEPFFIRQSIKSGQIFFFYSIQSQYRSFSFCALSQISFWTLCTGCGKGCNALSDKQLKKRFDLFQMYILFFFWVFTRANK